MMKIQVLSIKYKYDHLFGIYCLVFLFNAPFNNISTLSWENGRTSLYYYCQITFIRGVPIFMFFVGRLIVCLTDTTRNQSTHFLLFVLISCQRYVLDVNFSNLSNATVL